MLTKDFSGTYDYEREEARSESQQFLELLGEGFYDNDADARGAVDKMARHWSKALDHASFTEFVKHWNEFVPAYPMTA